MHSDSENRVAPDQKTHSVASDLGHTVCHLVMRKPVFGVCDQVKT